jgi:hypothetical protein
VDPIPPWSRGAPEPRRAAFLPRRRVRLCVDRSRVGVHRGLDAAETAADRLLGSAVDVRLAGRSIDPDLR